MLIILVLARCEEFQAMPMNTRASSWLVVASICDNNVFQRQSRFWAYVQILCDVISVLRLLGISHMVCSLARTGHDVMEVFKNTCCYSVYQYLCSSSRLNH